MFKRELMTFRVCMSGREKWENGDRAESRDSAMEAWWVFSRGVIYSVTFYFYVILDIIFYVNVVASSKILCIS